MSAAVANSAPPGIPALGSLGARKAAVLLVALGPQVAAEVLKHCQPNEVEALTVEISRMQAVDAQAQAEVLQECYELSMKAGTISSGGREYAEDLLVRAMGKQQATEYMSRLNSGRQEPPFQFINEADPLQLGTFLQDEHPQTTALVLSHLHSDKAAAILSCLPGELQAEVAIRIANMDRTNPGVVEEVERGLRRKLSMLLSQDYSSSGGMEFLVALLIEANRATERTVLEGLAQINPALAEEIKEQLFVFEDITKLDDRTIQRILREVDPKLLPAALKGASETVGEVIFSNMSHRAADLLREDIEAMGPTRVSEVENAQQAIVHTIRSLEEAGEIVIFRKGGGEEYV